MHKSRFTEAGPELDDDSDAKPTRVDRCATCKFSDADTQGEGYLLCRRMPPQSQTILGVGPSGPRVLGTVASVPRVSPNEWCGEWSPKNAIAS